MSALRFPQSFQSAVNVKMPVLFALLIIGLMLCAWKPWQANIKASDRTITVTGEATIRAVPDQYVFYPQYEFKNADRSSALKEATVKNNEIIAALLKLGVPKSKIKADTSGFNSVVMYGETGINAPAESTYSDSLTITLANYDQAQKVQDYLLTTAPAGSVTPQAGFSDKLRTQLESRGRDQAITNARNKANQTAANLGFKVGKVKSVSDGGPNQIIRPFDETAGPNTMSIYSTKGSADTLPIQSGENSLPYSVTITFYVR